MAGVVHFQKLLRVSEQRALIEVIRSHTSLTMGELAALTASHPAVGEVTVAELASSEAVSSRGAERRQKGPKTDTRSKAGRDEYDRRMLAEIESKRGTPQSASELRAICGGSALQARRALNRLIALGDVEYSGQARATKYFAR